MGPSKKADNVSKKDNQSKVPTISNNVQQHVVDGDDEQAPPCPQKLPLPTATSPVVNNVITIDGHTVVSTDGVSWTQQVPEKIKTVLWNIKTNSAALVDTSFPSFDTCWYPLISVDTFRP